jgi:hypothetical protein
MDIVPKDPYLHKDDQFNKASSGNYKMLPPMNIYNELVPVPAYYHQTQQFSPNTASYAAEIASSPSVQQ